MTLFLASVRDADEAELALASGADIVDLKDPATGALGALAPGIVATCVNQVGARAPVSATIGDLPLKGDAVRKAVLDTAALGVDYVKLGLFPGGDVRMCLKRLTTVAACTRLIVVLFADAMPGIDALPIAARIGAHGVMFDTMGKTAGSLTDHLSYMTLASHIAAAKDVGLVVGLAGSLTARQVPSLVALAPDLLGFRSALCRNGDRSQTLDAERLAAVRALIPERPRLLAEQHMADLAPQALC